jgi:hypothetical protein
MPLYLCRWPNSDASVVLARNKTEAIIRLDEFENAEGAQITRLTDFLVDFHLNDEGRLELGTFGEATEDEIMETAYPELEEFKTSDQLDGLDPEGEEYAQKIKQAQRQSSVSTSPPTDEVPRNACVTVAFRCFRSTTANQSRLLASRLEGASLVSDWFSQTSQTLSQYRLTTTASYSIASSLPSSYRLMVRTIGFSELRPENTLSRRVC